MCAQCLVCVFVVVPGGVGSGFVFIQKADEERRILEEKLRELVSTITIIIINIVVIVIIIIVVVGYRLRRLLKTKSTQKLNTSRSTTHCTPKVHRHHLGEYCFCSKDMPFS